MSSKITATLLQPEAQALADIQRQWRRAYRPDARQAQALAAVRDAAMHARRARTVATVQLAPADLDALLSAPRALRNGECLSDNQRTALAKLRHARLAAVQP